MTSRSPWVGSQLHHGCALPSLPRPLVPHLQMRGGSELSRAQWLVALTLTDQNEDKCLQRTHPGGKSLGQVQERNTHEHPDNRPDQEHRQSSTCSMAGGSNHLPFDRNGSAR